MFRKRAKTAFLVVLWFTTAVVGTIVNKIIMEAFPFPITFSIVHLVAGGVFDYMILRKRKAHFTFCVGQLRSCFLNGFFFGMAKMLTYISYELVPVSLAHTVKSSGPVFSVMTTNIWMRKLTPYTEILTLFPIVIGVTLSSVTEINFNIFGFIAAFSATLLGALQNTSGKIVMTKARNCDPVQLHFYAATVAVWILLPLSGLFEFREITKRAFPLPSVPVPPSAGSLSLLSLPDDAMSEYPPIPFGLIACSTVILYVQSMASLHVLDRVTTVSHNVTNTLKRFFIIVLSVLYFKNHVGIWNVFGILLAMGGFFSYAFVHERNKRRRKRETANQSSPRWARDRRDLEGGPART